jgi:hypothetical protein
MPVVHKFQQLYILIKRDLLCMYLIEVVIAARFTESASFLLAIVTSTYSASSVGSNSPRRYERTKTAFA